MVRRAKCADRDALDASAAAQAKIRIHSAWLPSPPWGREVGGEGGITKNQAS